MENYTREDLEKSLSKSKARLEKRYSQQKKDKLLPSQYEDFDKAAKYEFHASVDLDKYLKKGDEFSGRQALKGYTNAAEYWKLSGENRNAEADERLAYKIHKSLRSKTKSRTEDRISNSFFQKLLEGKVTATASIVGILGGLFFLSSNITGNAIANVSQSSGNVLGAVLLVVGLVAGFFWVKKK